MVSRLHQWLRRAPLRPLGGGEKDSEEGPAELGMDAFVLGDWEGAAGAAVGLFARWRRRRQAHRNEADTDAVPRTDAE